MRRLIQALWRILTGQHDAKAPAGVPLVEMGRLRIDRATCPLCGHRLYPYPDDLVSGHDSFHDLGQSGINRLIRDLDRIEETNKGPFDERPY